MLLLGIDVGTSSIKVSVMDSSTNKYVGEAQYPETESEILSVKPGWAEQDPEIWWLHVQEAVLKANAAKTYNPADIGAIGIAYQMHGLVAVDSNKKVLRNSIIWCDSRAVEFGNEAFEKIGEKKCLSHLLNSPGNFTASKLAWVKKNEPHIFEKIDKVMLPGDFIAMKLTGDYTTSVSALSEGIFWDFRNKELSKDVFNFFGFDQNIIPEIKPVFSVHGHLKKDVAATLSMKENIPVSYKAGDQPNNALSLNVLQPGEVAATAGTSGVIYSVSDQLTYDRQSRVNTFAHVNHTHEQNRLGVLLCINGTGIMNSWIKKITGGFLSYAQINQVVSEVDPGSSGLSVLPFGNGAERMLNNEIVSASIEGLDLNNHTAAHVYRAVQEGIVFAFRYGCDIMRENGVNPKVIRAGRANMFLSNVFTDVFVNTINVPVELFESNGSRGAAIGAGLGAGVYKTEKEAFEKLKPLNLIEPRNSALYNEIYLKWKERLQKKLLSVNRNEIV